MGGDARYSFLSFVGTEEPERATTPEVRLWGRVIWQALRDAQDSPLETERKEAARWLESPNGKQVKSMVRSRLFR